VRFETRRFEDGEAAFVLNPEKAGQYLLRFQRQDPVELATTGRLVALTVTEAGTASGTPAAPGAAPGASPVAAAGTAAAGAAGTTVAGTAPAATAPAADTGAAAGGADAQAAAAASLATLTDPAAIVAYARDELGASRIRTAMDALDRYLSLFPYGNDEVFFLYGVAYEQDTPFRNIKKAYEYYKRVRDEYPRSKRWREAADRIAYLERHYFGLR